MKITTYLAFVPLILLTACAGKVGHPWRSLPPDPKDEPETVRVTFHVKPGKEAELESVLEQAWKIYRQQKMVFSEPHVIIQDTEDSDKPRVTEIFAWVDHRAPDEPPAPVLALWKQMRELTEDRDGHNGVDIAEVTLLAPKESWNRPDPRLWKNPIGNP